MVAKLMSAEAEVKKPKKNVKAKAGGAVDRNMFSAISNILKVKEDEQSYFLLMNEISYESVQPVIEWILGANFAEEKPEQLTLLICSPGGLLSSCYALVDVMRGSSIPVATVAIGEIASAGTMITMNGHPGMRFCTTNTSIMSHTYSSGSFGKHHELIAAVKDFELTDKRIIETYKRCTGLSEKVIREVLLPASDVYLTPEEAKKYRIVDHIKDLG
jgi:ATP-dependent protease ClpP protease subunit